MILRPISTMGNALSLSLSPLHLTKDDIKNTCYLFLIFFVCYSFEINNFNLSIDDEVHSYAGIPLSTFSEIGRWLHPTVKASFWPHLVLPFGPYILFGLLISLSYVYILRALQVERLSLFHFVAFSAFALFPVWISQLEFSANIIPLGIALIAASISAYLTVQIILPTRLPGTKVTSIFFAVLGCAIATGAYQSALFIYPVIMLGALVAQTFRDREHASGQVLKGLLYSVGIMTLSIALYFIIANLTMMIFSIEASDYKNIFINPDTLMEAPLQVLATMARDIGNIYLVHWMPYGPLGYIYAITLVLGTLVLFFAFAASGVKASLTYGAMLVTLLAVPAAMSLLSGFSMPLRTFISAPIAFLMILILSYQYVNYRVYRRVVLILGMLAVMQGLLIHSVYQARTWTIQKHDLLLAAALNDAILRVASPNDQGLIPVHFRGVRKPESDYHLLYSTTSGASFFEWDHGNTYRMIRYMHMVGYHRYMPAPKERHHELASTYDSMPSWPAEGSVKYVDGVVMVKLSE